MIWLLKSDQPRPTEFAPAMDESTGILPGLPAVAGKPVHVAFDGGRVTSDAGILLAAIEQRLGIVERLADCIEDQRAPERVRHGLSEMIRYRALLIAAGYPDGTDCDLLKSDPAFKMAVGRLPESGADLCLLIRRCRPIIPGSCRSVFRHDVARLRRPAGGLVFGGKRAAGQSFAAGLGRMRRRLSPARSMRWALWTRRSRMASA